MLALQKEIEGLRAKLETVLAENEHLREAMKMVPQWVSVTERLPEKPGGYIVHIRWAETPTVLTYYGKRKNGEQLWYDEDGNSYNVTHWMPLPDGPKEDA